MSKTTLLKILLLYFSNILLGQNTPLFRIVENDKIGYIDSSGKKIIEPKFLDGKDFSEGITAARTNGRYGYIDASGNYIIQPKYDLAFNFKNKYACVYLNEKPLIIDKNDNIVLDTLYKSIHFIDNNKVIIKNKYFKQGIIDLATKKIIVDTIFNSIKPYKEGVYIVSKNKDSESKKNYAVIDSLGNFIVEFDKYDEIHDFVDGFARIEKNDAENENNSFDGVIDTKGNLIFQRQSNSESYISEDFHNKLAIIQMHKKTGSIIDEQNYQGYINL